MMTAHILYLTTYKCEQKYSSSQSVKTKNCHKSCQYHTLLQIKSITEESILPCLFATVAFGMGIQIPDIEVIILFIGGFQISSKLLSYWQEVGRAGRDGSQAYALCYAYGRSMIYDQENN